MDGLIKSLGKKKRKDKEAGGKKYNHHRFFYAAEESSGRLEGLHVHAAFDWKVSRARLSRSQALTHLAALSIAMAPVAMAAEKVLTATQQACCALGATVRARLCLFLFLSALLPLCARFCFVHTRLCVCVGIGTPACTRARRLRHSSTFGIRRCWTAFPFYSSFCLR